MLVPKGMELRLRRVERLEGSELPSAQIGLVGGSFDHVEDQSTRFGIGLFDLIAQKQLLTKDALIPTHTSPFLPAE
jgi:hypothetical protein